jgi:hypothetical protein
MGMQNRLAEPVNCCRREIVESRSCASKRCALGVCEPVWQDWLDECWNIAPEQRVHGIFDAPSELAGGEFCECDCGNFARFVTVREHHGDPTRQERGLARARSGLDQQYRCKIGHGPPTVNLVDEGHVDAFQSLLRD